MLRAVILELQGGTMTNKRTGKQGFASMSKKKVQEIASTGGKAAHASGNAHEFSPEEAREAGRKGGRN